MLLDTNIECILQSLISLTAPSTRERLVDGITAAERPNPAGFLWNDWEFPMAFLPLMEMSYFT
ncbi:MAG: hypothetical protein Ct9H90mP14_2920 [Methanobacteriota archaeon]|nr:MAG: hypothetical protein Ct9H90mP14_2920 [Euryarchaeota archaeon]